MKSKSSACKATTTRKWKKIAHETKEHERKRRRSRRGEGGGRRCINTQQEITRVGKWETKWVGGASVVLTAPRHLAVLADNTNEDSLHKTLWTRYWRPYSRPITSTPHPLPRPHTSLTPSTLPPQPLNYLNHPHSTSTTPTQPQRTTF